MDAFFDIPSTIPQTIFITIFHDEANEPYRKWSPKID